MPLWGRLKVWCATGGFRANLAQIVTKWMDLRSAALVIQRLPHPQGHPQVEEIDIGVLDRMIRSYLDFDNILFASFRRLDLLVPSERASSFYSQRRAVIGSTRAARLAGNQHANSAATNRIITTAT